MRISDWSSDVCSSDLKLAGRTGRELGDRADALGPLSVVAARSWACRRGMAAPQERSAGCLARSACGDGLLGIRSCIGPADHGPALGGSLGQIGRANV